MEHQVVMEQILDIGKWLTGQTNGYRQRCAWTHPWTGGERNVPGETFAIQVEVVRASKLLAINVRDIAGASVAALQPTGLRNGPPPLFMLCRKSRKLTWSIANIS